MMRKPFMLTVVVFGVALIFLSITSAAFVLRKGEQTYIEDQQGEHWDITQAQTLGFRPELFQYGIGRNAFTPLDDASLSDGSLVKHQNLRVIGIADGTKARAYSVSKLRYHEIANTQINEKSIVVGY